MNNIKVRVYILRALNLTAQDNFATMENFLSGFSSYCKANSYLEVILGHKYASADSKQVKYVDDHLNYIPNTLNPSFFKFYELEGELPQDWQLTVNVRSKKDGGLGGGSLIGSTVIDLEDRYVGEFKNISLVSLKAYEDKLNKHLDTMQNENKKEEEEIGELLSFVSSKVEGLSSKQVPVEYRPIFNPYKKTAQGVLEMFVEVLNFQSAKLIKPAKIEPPAPEQFELRLVIWECRDLPLDKKKTISAYITASMKPEGWLSKVSSILIFLGSQKRNRLSLWLR